MFGKFAAVFSAATLASVAPAPAADHGAALGVACPFGDCSAALSLSYLGEFVIPTGQVENGVPFGGVSGLDFDAETGRYIAVSDDRSERAPARFYHLDIDVSSAGLKGVTVLESTTLQDKSGQPFAVRAVDPESIRIGKGGIYWGSEGDARALVAPFVRVAAPDGAFVREFKLPEGFAPNSGNSTGIRDNLAFEALAVSPSGDVFVGLEAALRQDGPAPSLTAGSLARIVRYDGATGEPKAQYVYPISPAPQAAEVHGDTDNGVSEMIALDDRRLLVVERSFAKGFGNHVKIFMIDLEGATDVSGLGALATDHRRVVPARKSQVLDLRAIGLTPDNIEAMAIGRSRDGLDVLILGSDDNFSKAQKTQFYAFKIERLRP